MDVLLRRGTFRVLVRLVRYDTQVIFYTDPEAQFTSAEFVNVLEKAGVGISMGGLPADDVYCGQHGPLILQDGNTEAV